MSTATSPATSAATSATATATTTTSAALTITTATTTTAVPTTTDRQIQTQTHQQHLIVDNTTNNYIQDIPSHHHDHHHDVKSSSSSSSSTTALFWSFRPTVLQKSSYATLSIDEITDHYVADNGRALLEGDGVMVPPPPPPLPHRCRFRRLASSSSAEAAATSPTATATATPNRENLSITHQRHQHQHQHMMAAVNTTTTTTTTTSTSTTTVGRVSPSPATHLPHLPHHQREEEEKEDGHSSSGSASSFSSNLYSSSPTSRLSELRGGKRPRSSSGESSVFPVVQAESVTNSAAAAATNINIATNTTYNPRHHHHDNNNNDFAASQIRTAQWNIQAFTSPRDERSPKITNGIIQTINDVQADVIVLNEYHWNDVDIKQEMFERECLRRQGFHNYYCGSVITPTLIASRLPVIEFVEIVLSYERSAMCIKVDTTTATNSDAPGSSSGLVWVIGTHLDAFDGKQRLVEIERLMTHLKTKTSTFDPSTPILLMGDFNQQRQKDYTPKEWCHISTSMDKRNVCHDDGVASTLEQDGFRCVFDDVAPNGGRTYTTSSSASNPTTTTTTVQTNWNTSCPPSTHWSGTTIDYSYCTGNVVVDGVYISPAGYSDHRMTVCDWSVPTTTTTTTQATTTTARRATRSKSTTATGETTTKSSTTSSSSSETKSSTEAVFVDDHDSQSG